MLLIALAAVAAAVSFASPVAAQEAQITCASIGNVREVCRLGLDVSEVRLVRQTSKARCVLDSTWGIAGGKLWVDKSCGGVFRVTYVIDGPRRTPGDSGSDDGRSRDDRGRDDRSGAASVACNSVGGRPATCAIPRDVDWARVARRTSNAPCTWRDSWAAERGSIRVTRGCAAIFDLASGRRAPGPDWYRISDGGGWQDDRPVPYPVPYPGAGRPDQGDRRERAEERAAIRLCRRYGEDQPQLFDARWVEARPTDTFRADSRGRDIDVEGRYDVIRRGPDQSVAAACRVRGDRVVGFSVR
jgi:hypothetical protein